MIKCKKCESQRCVKNGVITGIQRYKCKDCGCNFRQVDGRQKPKNEFKKALAILLYGSCRVSYRKIGKLLNVSNVTVLNWVRKLAKTLPEPEISDSVIDVEFDEVWHFLKKNLKNCGLSAQFAVFHAKTLDLSVEIVISKHLKNSSKSLHI